MYSRHAGVLIVDPCRSTDNLQQHITLTDGGTLSNRLAY
jgi:hypothetical protein